MKPFYLSTDYEPLHQRRVGRGPLGAHIGLSDSDPLLRARMLGHFAAMSYEHVGILRGEYTLLANGLLLADRSGVLTLCGIAPEDRHAMQLLEDSCRSPQGQGAMRDLLQGWQALPVVHQPAVLTEPYNTNSFHFTFQVVARLRHLAASGCTSVVLQNSSLATPLQTDLLVRSLGGLRCMPLRAPLRVCDPVLVDDRLTGDALFWLRRTIGLKAECGDRRIYLRGGSGLPNGGPGSIAETAAWLLLLRDFGFETVEFRPEHNVADQLALLEGAGLILAAHGAALTALAYLQPPLRVVEVLGAIDGRIMQIASVLGFDYHGVFSDTVDAAQNIVADVDELRDVLAAKVAAMRQRCVSR